ncbi:MAG: flagellar brake protein [Desulfobulbaceae bacterium]|nr:flagellar brake protein [Desulfobulbaceae bacterium]
MKQTKNKQKVNGSRIQRVCKTDIAIPVGAEVVIQATEQGLRFNTTFIGLIKGRYLLVNRPESQKNIALSANDQLAVRYIAGNQVFGFISTLATITTNPFPIMFIDLPECYETLNLRKDDRIQCFQPAILYKESLEEKGKLTDISKSGCRIIINKQNDNSPFANLKANNEIFCSLQLPDIENNLYTKGIIRVSESLKTKTKLGIQFLNPEKDVQDAIARYVATTLEYMEGD